MWRDTGKARLERYQAYLNKNRYMCPGSFPEKIAVPEKMKAPKKQTAPDKRTASDDRMDMTGTWSEEQQVTFEMDCDYVLAPALDAYVLWVIREALRSGKKRLYFLARDGYLMYRTAQIYCQRFQLPIECSYLCCSRYSIRIPMFHLDMDEAMDYICRGGIDVTVRKILNRAGLAEEEQKQILEQIGMSGLEDEIVPYAQIPAVRKKLEKSELFYRLVTEHSRKEMPNLTGYLGQEGLLDDIPYALVDSGWVGSMQKVLGRVIAYMRKQDAHRDTRIEGYYWGLYELPEGVHAEDYHCYYFSPGNNLREKVYFSNCLFEGVFSAPHGMTLHYREEDGYFRPVYAEISPAHYWFMQEIEKRILRYVDKKADALLSGRTQTDAYKSLEEYLNHMDVAQNHRTTHQLLKIFMGEPTRQEAELFGQLQFSDDVLDEDAQQIAALLSQQELDDNHVGNKILTMLGVKKGHVKESAWYEGSAVRGGQDVQKHLRRYAGYKYLLYLRKKRVWSKRKDG